jgi:hypothetical protein
MATQWDFSIALASLIACACDAGPSQRNDVCVPQEVGPSGYVTHSDRGPVVLGGAELLAKIRFGRTSPARLSEVDSDLWLLVGAYCRPCTVPGDAKPIDEMFPTAYLPEAVAAGCFSLTLADGRIVYGDLRSRFHMSTTR